MTSEFKNMIGAFFEGGSRIAALGVGSVLRNDDAAGMIFAEKLAGICKSERLLVLGGGSAPENFTGVIKVFSPDILFIVDAAFMGEEPGCIKLLGSEHIGGLSFSTHMLPLPLMLDYLSSECGCKPVVIGIQPENTEQGLEVNPAVRLAAESLAELFASFSVNCEP